MWDQPVKKTKKWLNNNKSMVRKLMNRIKDKTINPKVAKSKATAVVMSLAKVSGPNEDGQRDSATHGGREKQNPQPPK